ncbi:MAG: inorganic phosphate transporter [Actinomycetales bacterium]|jgi:PiT family inorganic phosphate transporter|uniref:Phosphate transporter n=1 Tax=Candidatus Phosphoribacter hodrii TaxID=2953743 RepID=A0A935CEA0_9MICO|nr:inorganic phosphate transporter [Candidatus Phosphoribacter hodrii]MBL0003058.1 inorganic phosphate transporter [Candidatus Phosphoribacter hodrii]
MTTATMILALVVVVALAFDFTNGFHDTGNAMAASIATGALSPKGAVTLAAILNLVGALLSVEVALTVSNSVVNLQDKAGLPLAAFKGESGAILLLLIVFGGLIGGIIWNLFTWLLGLPSSSSHALLGGLVGGTIGALGFAGVKWAGDGTKLDGVIGKVLLPSLLSPVIAMIVAATATRVIFMITAKIEDKFRERRFRWGQVGAASLVSLAHGTNDAQKTMGVITLALVATGTVSSTAVYVPLWVKLSAAIAIALGTYLGGWRIIHTMGKGLVDISSPQGLAADASSATVILASSQLGFALSTTHVATGSIMGTGIGKKGATVRWSVAGRMVAAWAITFPAAAVMGAIMFWIANGIGGIVGPLIVFAILCGLSFYMWKRSRHNVIDHTNVNDEWHDGSKPEVAVAAHDIIDPHHELDAPQSAGPAAH